MNFRDALLNVDPSLNSHICCGLQAIKRADRQRVAVRHTRSLSHSIDLDLALRGAYPNDPRWDYGVGVTVTGHSDRAVWIEVHPASSLHVQAVLKKLAWLKQWLSQHRQPVWSDFATCWFVWVASGRSSLPPQSPQRRMISSHGLRFAGSRYVIDTQ
jgi:hypothetical protein